MINFTTCRRLLRVANKRSALVLPVFVILGFLIYSNTLDVPFHFDDEPNIVENPNIRLTGLSLKDITKACFKSACPNRPIANLSFALNYYFHKYDVAGYHVINIVIHIITGILLYFFIKITLSIPSLCSRYKSPSSIALFAALIWLVHPVQTQSVTYIVQRMNSMAAMFYVLSFLLYVKARLVKENQKAWPWFAGCVIAGLLAIGSKETAATLPFFILLYEWYFFQDLSKAWLRRSIPYIVCAFVIFGFLAFAYMGLNPFERILSGYASRDFTLYQRVLTQFRVVIYYLSLLVYPHPSRLNLDHDIGLSYSFIDPITTLISITAVLAMVGLAFYIARKDRLISFSILWFFGNLLIESSVIALEIMFEHRVYLPSMFFFLSIVVLAYRFIRPYWDWVVVVVLIAVALLFSMWTYERNSVWRDPITFWSDVVKKSPDKARPHNNLGIAYTEKGLIKKAIIEIKKAIDLKPGFVNAYVSLGNAYLNKGLFDMAIKEYRNALRLRSDYAEVYVNIGNAYIKKGTIDRAIESYSKALTLKPDSIRARFNIASAYGLKGFTKKVLAEYKALAELQPDNPDIHFNLGIAYERLAKSEDQRAERRGHVVMDQEQRWLIEQAVNEYKKALKLSPNDFQARRNIDRIKKWYKNQTAID